MVEKFEEYIGSLIMISDVPDKKGLHHRTEGFVHTVLEKNIDNVRVVLRDMKLNKLNL
jgi:hypothetical protein